MKEKNARIDFRCHTQRVRKMFEIDWARTRKFNPTVQCDYLYKFTIELKFTRRSPECHTPAGTIPTELNPIRLRFSHAYTPTLNITIPRNSPTP